MSKVGLALNAELGLSASTTNGLGLSPSLSFDYKKHLKIEGKYQRKDKLEHP